MPVAVAMEFVEHSVMQMTEPDMWRAFTEGSQQAYSALFLRYKDILYTYGCTITADEELVCDCIQELFLELWMKKKNLTQVNAVRYYLLVSFRRLILSKIEGIKKNSQSCKQASVYINTKYTESTEDALIHEQILAEMQNKLSFSVSHLPSRQQEALYLRYYEKLTYEEIMQVMTLSYKSVRNLVSLAIQGLRKELQKQDFFYTVTLLFCLTSDFFTICQ